MGIPTTITVPNATTVANNTTIPGPKVNIWMIAGISGGGAVVFIICCVIILYCVIRRRRGNSEQETKKVRYKKGDEVHENLIKELGKRNSYIKTSTKENTHNDADGYITLADNANTTPSCSVYSEVFDSSDQKAVIKEPMMPKPIPKPRQLKSTQEEINDTSVNVLSVRKPMPAPRPTILSTKNELYSEPDIKEAENELYGTPDISGNGNGIYSEPDISEDIYSEPEVDESFSRGQSTIPSTSAQMFNRSSEDFDCHDEVDDKNFAMYVPVGERDVIYKVPSNIQKFDPPKSTPTSVNEFQDIYTNMHEDANCDRHYEDVGNIKGEDSDYEDMISTSPNNRFTDTYQVLSPMTDTYENINAMGLDDNDDDEFTV